MVQSGRSRSLRCLSRWSPQLSSSTGYVSISNSLFKSAIYLALNQDSVPAALTKDKKKIRKQEIAVHLAWKSTLYVTNFPESTDDAVIRDLFGQVGRKMNLTIQILMID